MSGGVGEKIKICQGGSAKFSISPPPTRISNGIALSKKGESSMRFVFCFFFSEDAKDWMGGEGGV